MKENKKFFSQKVQFFEKLCYPYDEICTKVHCFQWIVVTATKGSISIPLLYDSHISNVECLSSARSSPTKKNFTGMSRSRRMMDATI